MNDSLICKRHIDTEMKPSLTIDDMNQIILDSELSDDDSDKVSIISDVNSVISEMMAHRNILIEQCIKKTKSDLT